MTNDYKLGYVTGRSNEGKIILDIVSKLRGNHGKVKYFLISPRKDLSRDLPDIF